MKQLITKSDGTPTKSKVFAIKFLQDKGIDESCLIQENGQFFYEGVNEDAEAVEEVKAGSNEEEKTEVKEAVEEVKEEEINPEEEEAFIKSFEGAPDFSEFLDPIMEEVNNAMLKPVTWETPVYDKSNEKTVLIIPGTDIKATINAKHPGGQIRPTSAFEIAIGQENFIMSLDLVSKLFKVRG